MGHRIVGRITITGPEAREKADKAAEIFWAAAGGRELYEATSTQLIGWSATHPPVGFGEPSELLLQVSARDTDREKLETRFAPFVVGTGLASVPGFSIPSDQGRPHSSPVLAHWPALIDRGLVSLTATVGDQTVEVPANVTERVGKQWQPACTTDRPGLYSSVGPIITVPLSRLCLARSGDKGDTSNIGVIGRSDAIFDWMCGALTSDVIKERFRGICLGDVERFVLPNLRSMNFLLRSSLGGGGTASLRFDPQGKTYAQYLLALPVQAPESLLGTLASFDLEVRD
jgi:hypothetical protein